MARRMNETRERILSVSKELFAKYGYRKTTIRLIINESGISSGSIYNMFKNKDEIFQAIVDETLDRCIDLVNTNFPSETPSFKFAAISAIELNAIITNTIVRDIYFEAYTSNYMFEHLVKRNIKLQNQLFSDEDIARTEKKDQFINTLLMKGTYRSFLVSFYFAHKTDPFECMDALLHQILLFLNCDEREQRRIMEKIHDNRAMWILMGKKLLKQ